MKRNLVLLVVCFLTLNAAAQQKLTPVDAESKVHFVIKNVGIGTGGDLTGLKGQILLDKKQPANSTFDITVDVATIDTDNERRDKHLRADDYFDAAKFPTIRIAGKGAVVAGGTYVLKANLTIRDVTKPVEIPFTVTPQAGGFLFEGAFKIDRLQYNVGG
ncbi:MAG: YceI family protein, partial [Gloeobacteraceae cyanobacterium ES-bin-316]|nr:YceI family protein [Ferruginibacter sp.]